jgi:hypothetical protein
MLRLSQDSNSIMEPKTQTYYIVYYLADTGETTYLHFFSSFLFEIIVPLQNSTLLCLGYCNFH